MKPCPECGGPLHFVANRWLHAGPHHCLLITLLATPEEIAQHGRAPTPPGARLRQADAASSAAGKFGYLASGAGD
jgi:hypothetical protein